MDRIVLVGENGKFVCELCEVADGFFSRGRGLLGRKRLSQAHGMQVKPAWSVHTFFMRFPIDVVFLDPQLTVIKVKTHMRPWRVTARFGANSALELTAGECDRLGIAVGDRLAWGSLKAG